MVKQTLVLILCAAGFFIQAIIHADTLDQPDLEFLEFLAEWQSDQGDWIGPVDLQELAHNEPGVQSTEVQGDE